MYFFLFFYQLGCQLIPCIRISMPRQYKVTKIAIDLYYFEVLQQFTPYTNNRNTDQIFMIEYFKCSFLMEIYLYTIIIQLTMLIRYISLIKLDLRYERVISGVLILTRPRPLYPPGGKTKLDTYVFLFIFLSIGMSAKTMHKDKYAPTL